MYVYIYIHMNLAYWALRGGRYLAYWAPSLLASNAGSSKL